jgi:hypothetical protein
MAALFFAGEEDAAASRQDLPRFWRWRRSVDRYGSQRARMRRGDPGRGKAPLLMVPLHVEDAGDAVTIAFEGETPRRVADAIRVLGVQCRRQGRYLPARARGAGLAARRGAKKQTGDAAFGSA